MEFANEFGQARFEADSESDVSQRTGTPKGNFAGVGAGLPNDKVGRVLFGRRGAGVPFGQVGGRVGIGRAAGAGEIPSAVVDQTTVLLLPKGMVPRGVEQRVERAGNHGNLGAVHDFQEAQSVADLQVAPVVAGGDADA